MNKAQISILKKHYANRKKHTSLKCGIRVNKNLVVPCEKEELGVKMNLETK